MAGYQFRKAAVGGTFDRFHRGHEALLATAFSLSSFVFIGVTTKNLHHGKVLSDLIEPYATRVRCVQEFLTKYGYEKRSHIIPLDHPFGILRDDPSVECVVVTRETRKKAEEAKKLLPHKKLHIITAPFICSSSGTHLSSTMIRRGEMDREGNVYTCTPKEIPLMLLPRLRKPFGSLSLGQEDDLSIAATKIQKKIAREKPFCVITVGDVTTYSLVGKRIPIDIAVCDGKVKRKKDETSLKLFSSKKRRVFEAVNPKRSISPELMSGVRKSLDAFLEHKERVLLHVYGEEDLSVLPFGLFAPLSSMIIYGQPGKGLVSFVVTEGRKRKIQNILAVCQELKENRK
ncbi:MAG TPA: pantetheine-phosphate adenylyltransferase [Patescibacteria group bacterium]|nr:pantetheine-phosphate adenylyltransferase [Patescibacteria group bacterium]